MSANATHNRGGEITFQRIGPLTFKIKITTYTKIGATADRPKLYVEFGDGQGDSIPRLRRVQIAPTIQKNDYETTHNYPVQGRFFVSVTDPNRNAGVKNIPNSVNTPFHIESMLVINPFLNPANSVILLNPPIDFGCVGRIFVHNPNAYDPDGDSLSFEIIDCRGENGNPIPGYSLPPGNISLDSHTGQFIWNSPTQVGEYNFAFLIKEWRSGVNIGSIIRDIQVDITNCSNTPPIIQPLRDTCIKAGDLLKVTVLAIDTDMDRINLSATGGPFEFWPDSARLKIDSMVNGRTVATFSWRPPCLAVRKEPYQVLFKAQDIPPSPQTSLVDLRPWHIRVVSPPPTLTSAVSRGGKITITWDNSTTCTGARGYKIYRRQGGPSGIIPDVCDIGPPEGSGYVLIDTTMGFNNTTYVDDNKGAGLGAGVEYCYVVTALFSNDPRQALSGTESCISNELCEIVKRDLPVITRADIEITDANTGRVRIEYAAPTELDTTQFPGPYEMVLYRSEGFTSNASNAMELDRQSFASFWQITDGFFLDQNANTLSTPNSYWMEFFFNSNEEVGLAKSSSTVFLSINPLPSSLLLNWNYNVNWTNDSFFVYRDEGTGFQILDTVLEQRNYLDSSLVDGKQYCYYVQSSGAFGASTSLPQYILNRSQEKCDFPRDSIPPCPPVLMLNDSCQGFSNTLSWFVTDSSCIKDLKNYRIYFQDFFGREFVLIDSVNRDISSYIHMRDRFSIAGCYAVVAVDSSFNESVFSNVECVDNCPKYRLPNVFTPNGDAKNQFFGPFPYRFIDRVNMKIFNRWGQMMFKTENPDINWDGRNHLTGGECPNGVYYYTCEIFEIGFEGIKTRAIKGVVQLIREIEE